METREHYITATCAKMQATTVAEEVAADAAAKKAEADKVRENANADQALSKLVRTSKSEFLKTGVINEQPPPQRKIVLVLGAIDYDQLFQTSLEKVFGFVFGSSVCLDGFNLTSQFTASLSGLIARALQENKKLKHCGLSVRLFTPGSFNDLQYVYDTMTTLCETASDEVNIDFDFIQNEYEFRAFLTQAVRRIVHGDTSATFAASYSPAGRP